MEQEIIKNTKRTIPAYIFAGYFKKSTKFWIVEDIKLYSEKKQFIEKFKQIQNQTKSLITTYINIEVYRAK